jgi:predicted outer membrane lipoprotein
MSASLKAGLIGAGVAVLFSLLSLVPCLGCITAILGLVLYFAVGVLTANWMEPPRDVGKAAGNGAVAGLITALGGGIANLIISALRFTVGGGQAAVMRQLEQLPPDVVDQLRDLGVRPGAFASPGWAIGGSAVCCSLGVLLAAALGAAGGAIAVSLRRE